jgi:hypothetical protein
LRKRTRHSWWQFLYWGCNIEVEEAFMIGRPCKPDNDLKGLWRTLLGTPFPACGVADSADAADGVEASRNENQSVEQDVKASAKGA